MEQPGFSHLGQYKDQPRSNMADGKRYVVSNAPRVILQHAADTVKAARIAADAALVRELCDGILIRISPSFAYVRGRSIFELRRTILLAGIPNG